MAWFVRFSQVITSLILLTSLWGCTPAVTWQALQARGLEAKVHPTCIRPPPFAGRGEFYATNEATREMVSDEDPEAFWEAAPEATAIHRYDPNAPSEPGPGLPWPYDRMTCEDVSSGNVPALPKGMKEIPISREMREALVSVLIKRELREGHVADLMGRDKPNGAMLGQVLITPPRLEQYTSAIDEVGQMLRDAVRGQLPTVKREGAGPDDEEVSIIDTKTGQVLGGFGAGLGLSLTPGGVFIADGLRSGDMPKPTREFMLAEGFGEMAGGVGQGLLGTGMAAGGGGLSATGGGAVVGVPTCAAGVALAANGAVTFLHGANTVLVALCHWEELPAAPAAASASSMETPPAATNAAVPPSAVNAGSAVKPALNTAPPPPPPAKPPITPKRPAAQPIATEAKPAAPVPEAPPPGTTIVHKSASGTTTATRRRVGPGEKPPPETTTITTTEGGGTTVTTTRVKAEPAKPSTTATTSSATNGHHPWPKYLGGPAKQDLAKLSESLHKSYHSGLDKILPRQRGTAYYDKLSPQAKQQLMSDLAAYTKAFDAKYGTRLYDSMLRNGFSNTP